MFRLPLLTIIFWFGAGLGLGWAISTAYQSRSLSNNFPAPAVVQKVPPKQNVALPTDDEKRFRDAIVSILEKHENRNIPSEEISLNDRRILESNTQNLIDNNINDAQNILHRWLDSNPYDPQAMFLMARTHAEKQEYEKALELALMLKTDPQITVPAETIDTFIDEIVVLHTAKLRETKQLDRLLSVYQKLVLELPDPQKYYYQLAQIQNDLNLNTDALTSLNYVLYDSVWGQLAQKLAQEIQIKLDLVNKIQVPLERAGEQFIVIATINGIGGIRLLIDTGASMCILRPQTAIQIGLPVEEGQNVLLSVASGVANARSVTLDSIEIGAAQLKDVLSSILEMPPGMKSDGLLGMNFLSRFNFFIDQNDAVLYLGAR